MELKKPTSFAACVRSPDRVRSAFSEVPVANLWWRVILGLHGKPLDGRMTACAARPIVAAGFSFYSTLYGGLGLLLLTLGIVCWQTYELPSWAVANMLASVLLFMASGVARRGAVILVRSPFRGTICLVLFLVMVMAFLSMLLSGLSIAAVGMGVLSLWAGLTVFCIGMVFGVGSYMIELVYLVHAVAKDE